MQGIVIGTPFIGGFLLGFFSPEIIKFTKNMLESIPPILGIIVGIALVFGVLSKQKLIIIPAGVAGAFTAGMWVRGANVL